jgi:hypothetical protein
VLKKTKRYRAEPREPLGSIRSTVISLNRLAMDLIGNPMSFTLTSQGLDLIVLPGGPLKVKAIYAPTGHATLRISEEPVRLVLKPGRYRVGARRYLHLKGLVFHGALLIEQSWVQP